MLDDRIDELKRTMEPPWDDVREQRVLSRVLSTPEPAPTVRSWRAPAIAGAVALAVAAAVAIVATWALRPMPPAAVATPAAPTRSEAPTGAHSVLSLADGSLAILDPGARVDTDEQTPSRVRLRQRAGTVRYDVARQEGREFVVAVEGIRVHVVGTVFVVTLTEDEVAVEVDQGEVEVVLGSRRVRLAKNERFTVEREQAAPVQPEAGDADPPPASAAALMARADAARRSGNLDAAVGALHELLANHSADPRALTARFTLGRLETQRGNHAAAARHFQSCRLGAPGSPLAEDALAEEAVSWSRAGSSGQAAAAAREYLERHSAGTHANRMRRLIE